jgi:DNA-binding NarL/FixJ family response regulator
MDIKQKKFLNLSKRENEVVYLLTTGSSNREIAEKMYLTEGTVKSYMHNILTKLDLRNRYEIIIRFTQIEDYPK